MLEALFKILFEAICEPLLWVGCTLTGHIILWMLTLGRWNFSFSWELSNDRDDLASIVGGLFWLALVAIGVWLVFLR